MARAQKKEIHIETPLNHHIMTHRTHFISLIALFFLLFSACKEEEEGSSSVSPVTPAPKSLTAIELRFQLLEEGIAVEGASQTIFQQDLGAEGTASVHLEEVSLLPDKSYSVSAKILHTQGSSLREMDVAQEGERYQLFYLPSEGLNITHSYGDKDENGHPLGLRSIIQTSAVSAGTLKVILQRALDKSASEVSNGNIANAGGDTALSVDVNIRVDSENEQPEEEVSQNEVDYEIVFNFTWSSTSHPTNYPGSGAHFTTLIGALHNDALSVWAVGDIVGSTDPDTRALPGMENMAEDGVTSVLRNDLTPFVTSGEVKEILTGSGGTITLSATLDHHLVSVASMLAPSPDWFVGLSSFSLLKDGSWIDNMTLDMRVYDAGTEQGNGFSRGNAASSPHEVICPLTTPSSDTDFNNGRPKVGTITIRRR